MHPKTLLASAVGILPVASVLATHPKSASLETDAYSARATINQRNYSKKHSPESWKVCNDKNTIVRKEWYAAISRHRWISAALTCKFV